jgi:3D (Asp-Asp-Asp) domain-containing protein/peptidoglycan hydrolase CwlO-like protein
MLAGLLASSAALASSSSQTRAPSRQTDSRVHSALLDLYALDSRLHAAHERVAYLESETVHLQRRQRDSRVELGTAASSLHVSQHSLAMHLRALYEQGNVDPLAVVFGASSLGNGLSKLDDLSRVADESRQVVAATSAARSRLLYARRMFASRAQRLARSLATARAAEASLAATVAARTSYIASLRAQIRQSQVPVVVAKAQAAEQKSRTVQPGAPVTVPPPSGGRKLTVSATCYILRGTTASGLPVGPGIVAVDPNVIPLGTKLFIPGYGKGVAADVGGGIKGAIIDLWYSTYAQCAKWGRRTVTITIY